MTAARRRPARRRSAGRSFDRLVRVMAILRSPRGCPWDRRQTPQTLRPFLLEEAYEAVEAIDSRDWPALRGELGDVLLQVVFHAEMASQSGRFTIEAVVDGIVDKLIRRHPHVFTSDGRPLPAGSARRRQAATASAVVDRWQQIKAREAEGRRRPTRVLAGVPRALPALLGASNIGGRVAAVGFDWPRAADVVDKIDEEVRELRDALNEGEARAAEEMGDLLFSIANLARKLHIDPESALREANAKFVRRFDAVERHLAGRGRTVHDASADELEAAWAAVKAAPTRQPSSGARSSSARRRRGRPSRS